MMMGPLPSSDMSSLPLWKRAAKPAPPDSKDPNIVKLPRNGPKQGQSVDAWLYGKERGHLRATEINMGR